MYIVLTCIHIPNMGMHALKLVVSDKESKEASGGSQDGDGKAAIGSNFIYGGQGRSY